MKSKDTKKYILLIAEDYWDCMCEKNYVHSLGIGNYCPICKSHYSNMPLSFVHDVTYNYNPELDKAIQYEEEKQA